MLDANPLNATDDPGDLDAPGPVLFDAALVQRTVARLAAALDEEYRGKELTLLTVMNGALMFTADLLRLLPLPTRVESVRAASYRGTNRGGLQMQAGALDVAGRHVVIVDDILDSGRTLHRIREHVGGLRPATLRTCVLLDKPGCRQVEIDADWVGLAVPDVFVVGYGLDHDGRYRNLPFIAALNTDQG